MTTDRDAALDAGHLLVLDEDECRALILEAGVGRVCWQSDRGLQALPVAFGVAVDGRLGVRVSTASVLAQLAEPTPVVVQIDDIDPGTLTGWSVLVRGVAQAWSGEFPPGLCQPWAPGARSLALQVTPTSFSGRAVSAA